MPREPQRFVRLRLVEARLPFRFSFGHAAAQRSENATLLLELHDDHGTVGYGEAIPRPYLSGETLATAAQAIAQRYWPALKELRFTADEAPAQTLASTHAMADAARELSAYGALDVAAHDAWGRRWHVPGARLLGAPAAAQPLTWTVGFGGAGAKLAKAARVAGFREFKAKVGAALGADTANLAQVRAAIGGKASLRVDANGAWTQAEALAAAEAFARYDVGCIEEPLAAAARAQLGSLAKVARLPLMADESLITLQDARALIADAPDLRWNLRLAKNGGFTGLLKLCELATRHGIACQLGALVGETSLLTAAARAALGAHAFTAAESSFPRLLLKADPFRGGPSPWTTSAQPLTAGAGLGVEPNAPVWLALSQRELTLT